MKDYKDKINKKRNWKKKNQQEKTQEEILRKQKMLEKEMLKKLQEQNPQEKMGENKGSSFDCLPEQYDFMVSMEDSQVEKVKAQNTVHDIDQAVSTSILGFNHKPDRYHCHCMEGCILINNVPIEKSDTVNTMITMNMEKRIIAVKLHSPRYGKKYRKDILCQDDRILDHDHLDDLKVRRQSAQCNRTASEVMSIDKVPSTSVSSGSRQDIATVLKGYGEPKKEVVLPAVESPESQNVAAYQDSRTRSNSSINVPMQHSSAIQIESVPHSWDAEIEQHSNDYASLNKFIQSYASDVLTQKDEQRRTVCHAFCSLCHHLSVAEVEHLLESLSCVRLDVPHCIDWQDSSGNTPLHCAIETQNASNIVKSILDFVPPECLAVRNADNCTPLDLAFEKKLWATAKVLAEHQLKTGATNSSQFLQGYFFKAMREQGGVDFLPHLLELQERYCSDFDLNFGMDHKTGRTPWWYLANSNDVSVWCRVLQALKSHSVDLTSLLTHTGTGATLVEEAAEKNEKLFLLINKVAGWHHSEGEADPNTEDQDITLGSSRTLSQTSSCSLTDLSSVDESERSHDHHFELDIASVIESQSSHMSSTLTSDSSDEERHQFVSKSRKVSKPVHKIRNKGRASSTSVQNQML